MKAVTAFRNYIKSRAEILQTRISYILDVDEELSIKITFKINPKKERQEYEIFLKARERAKKTYEECILSRTDNGDVIQ